MADDGMNLCQSIWSHELAMRRLLSLLRQSQSDCSDSECFQFNSPNNGDNNGMMLMTLFWLAIAFFLYMYRPSSIRGEESVMKPRNNGNGNGSDPPASPNAF